MEIVRDKSRFILHAKHDPVGEVEVHRDNEREDRGIEQIENHRILAPQGAFLRQTIHRPPLKRLLEKSRGISRTHINVVET